MFFCVALSAKKRFFYVYLLVNRESNCVLCLYCVSGGYTYEDSQVEPV